MGKLSSLPCCRFLTLMQPRMRYLQYSTSQNPPVDYSWWHSFLDIFSKSHYRPWTSIHWHSLFIARCKDIRLSSISLKMKKPTLWLFINLFRWIVLLSLRDPYWAPPFFTFSTIDVNPIVTLDKYIQGYSFCVVTQESLLGPLFTFCMDDFCCFIGIHA